MMIVKPIVIFSFLTTLITSNVFAQERFYDPTQPSPSSMEVTSIYYTNEKRVAVINGIRYSEGDIVGGWVIDNILNNQVIIDHQGNKLNLYIAQSFSKDES